MSRLLAWLQSVVTIEVSSRSLGLLRVFVTLTMYTEFASPWVTHKMDDSVGTLLLSQTIFLAASFVLFGYQTKYATIVLASAFAGLHLYYGVELGNPKLAAPVHEFQLLILLAVTPCGRSLSVDRALEVRRAIAAGRRAPPERVQWWQLELFVVLIASIHFWTAVECSQAYWLSGAQLEHDLMMLWSGSDMFVVRPWAHEVAVGIAWFVTISAYVVAATILVRRWRGLALWLAVALQFAALFSVIHNYVSGYYNLMMLAGLLACLDPARVHAVISTQGDAV